MQNRQLMNSVRPFISAIAFLAITAMLVFTIYFTRVSMEWPTFLGGVLVAAMLAEATRVSRAEWVLMRRTAQLSALKDRFERESQLRKSAEETVAAVKPRLHLIDESIPTMVAFMDAEGQCRYHNRAFRDWLHLRPEKIDGRHISEILGAKIYQEIASSVRQSMDGHPVTYERAQKMANGAMCNLAAEHLPQFGDGGKVAGFYMLINNITGSVDVAAMDSVDQVAADRDMYVVSFSEHLTGEKDAGAQIVAAIEKDEFRLFCQQIAPLQNTPDGAEYHEILIRLMEEEEGMIPPGAFFPLAEKLGLMSNLDRWVVRHVMEHVSLQSQQKKWRDGSIFFINVADATLDDRGFLDYLKATLLEYGVPGPALCFEISHTDLIAKNAAVAEFARGVSQYGCLVALSGFGRDRISFDLIRGFRVGFLKIDGSIILNVLDDSVSLAKVKAINEVARKIGVKTIAEMVEDGKIIVKLKDAGVDFVQGFGISRPRPLVQ
jgi:PAS domain S-box-containing protein